MTKYLETPLGKPQRKSLEERLREYPEVRARIERMLDVMENVNGDVVKADEAEQRFIEELRKMGQEVLQSWADGQQQHLERYWNGREGVSRKDKKNSTGTRGSE